MSSVDISHLAKEDLPAGTFPAGSKADFRLHMAQAVHEDIQKHAKADTSVEICGVLVGRWESDADGPYASITASIRCDNATSKFAEVTFTHESWAHINQEMDSKHPDLRIIGWYHSHPDFGIFLSDRDVFIHENFFSGPGQVAYVVDPVRDLEGVFIWKGGKPTPIPHYWTGDRVRTVDAATRAPSAAGATKPAAMSPVGAPAAAAEEPTGYLSAITVALSAVAVFLLGYMFAGQRSEWERAAALEGAVVHYGITKLMKAGFEENMAKVESNLNQISVEYAKLPTPNTELSEEELSEARARRREIYKNLQAAETMVKKMRIAYGLSDVERKALAALIVQKQAELLGAKVKTDSGTKKTNDAEADKTKGAKKPDEPAKKAEEKTEKKTNEKAEAKTEEKPKPAEAERSTK